MLRITHIVRVGIGSGFLLLLLGVGGQYGMALSYGSGTFGTCSYGSCAITLTSSGTVNINVAPSIGTTCTVQSDAVGVTTDASTGYTLTFKDNDTTNSMDGSSTSIPSIGGTQASPVALTANTWGYRVDGIGGFGAGPTSAGSNIAPPSGAFAAVPLSTQSADTLATSSSAADPTVTTSVWYGLCVNASVPSGTYSDSVVYTALTN